MAKYVLLEWSTSEVMDINRTVFLAMSFLAKTACSLLLEDLSFQARRSVVISNFSFVLFLVLFSAGCGLLAPEQEAEKVKEQEPPVRAVEKPALESKPEPPAESTKPPDEVIRPVRLEIESLSQEEIRGVQARLQASGFDPGPLDGIPGVKTKLTLRRLQSSCSALEGISELSDLVNSQSNPAAEMALLTAPAHRTFSKEEVVRVQAALKTNGFDPGPVDGIFGLKTKSALLRVESGCSLARKYRAAEVTAFPVVETKPVLTSVSVHQTETVAVRSAKPSVSLGRGEDTEIAIQDKYAGTDEIRVVQVRLKDAGFDPGPVDGISGPKTQSALARYRASRGFRDTTVQSSAIGPRREY